MPEDQGVIQATAEGKILPSHFTGDQILSTVLKEGESEALPELHQKVQLELQTHAISRQWPIIVSNDGGVVVLRGTVTTYFAKQMAQEIVRPILNAHDPRPILRNLIDVVKDQ
jgi:hypothetical protein